MTAMILSLWMLLGGHLDDRHPACVHWLNHPDGSSRLFVFVLDRPLFGTRLPFHLDLGEKRSFAGLDDGFVGLHF